MSSRPYSRNGLIMKRVLRTLFFVICASLAAGSVQTQSGKRCPDESMLSGRSWGQQLWTMMPAQVIVAEFLATFREYPPSQSFGTFGMGAARATAIRRARPAELVSTPAIC